MTSSSTATLLLAQDPESGMPKINSKELGRSKTKKTCLGCLIPLCCFLVFVGLLSLFLYFATSSSAIKFFNSTRGARGKGIVNLTESEIPKDFQKYSRAGNLTTDIGSWFNCNENAVNGITTGTNGNSWCGYPYNDSMNGFAISLLVMCESKKCEWTDGQIWVDKTKLFCGLEAWVYNPRTKKNATSYVIDAFAPLYLEDMGHTPGSIDATPALFELLGEKAVDKMTVIEGVQFDFTGRRDMYYAAAASY